MAKIAVISDTHYAPSGPIGGRLGDIADILLLRAVRRLNRFIRPDVTVMLGDLVDDNGSTSAASDRARMRNVLAKLESPLILVPGNHDEPLDAFFSDMPRPADSVDIAGVRFLAFFDRQEPGCHASRSEADLARMSAAAADFKGPVVSLQHVPVFPPGLADCCYRYLNDRQVVDRMHASGVTLAISGHFHPGFDPVSDGRATYVCAPALCQAPFEFLVLEVDAGRIRSERHALAMPSALGLVDCHVHTNFARCSENMRCDTAARLADTFGLAGLVFTEHSDHLYFPNPYEDNRRHHELGLDAADPLNSRQIEEYFAEAGRYRSDRVRVGLEVEVDFKGRLIVREADRARCDLVVGAVHDMDALASPEPDMARCADEFLFLSRRLCEAGVDVLAHPFRVFRRKEATVPPSLFRPLCHILKETGVAAELNFHTNEPSPEFFKLCLDSGVTISFGSDAHNLCEVGEFAPHLDMLRAIGFDGDLKDILLPMQANVAL